MTEFGTLDSDGTFKKLGDVDQADMLKCPFFIIDFYHYREDGTCKCNDPEERERMKREFDYTDEDFREVGLI